MSSNEMLGKVVSVASAYEGFTGFAPREAMIGIVVSVLDEPAAMLQMKNGGYQQYPLSKVVVASEQETVDYWKHRAHDAEYKLHQTEQKLREAEDSD